MVLSNKACEQLASFIVQMGEFLPGPMRRAIGVSESFIHAAIMRDRDRLEKSVLEPLHGWLHEHDVAVRHSEKPEQVKVDVEAAKKKVQDGIQEVIRIDTD